MSATASRMTVDDYYATSVEGDRKQLVDGRIVVNEPRVPHALLQGRIFGVLFAWANERAGRGVVMGPTDVRLGRYDVYGPDVIWVADERPALDPEQRLARVPDLCVEIRSPSTWRYDIGAKRDAYERGGLPELWLVDDRAERVLVFRRSEPDSPAFDVALELTKGEALTSPQLPGFALPLERLFRP
jgi:Uma2 family endonuclease